ncbi:unnamed protein product [Allacma fusca]|uniref:Uncharacterized protein n=1 Tax=Allacma fusca TaxID=39272 RepID=A0A8J2KLM4_9HEXA|nr:unnamed protein product [Allacma fusca]
MGDNLPRMNPHKIFFQVGKDKDWRSITTSNISTQPSWILPSEPILFDNLEEDVTVGHVSKTITEMSKELKKLWNDKLLNKLECMSEGCCDYGQTTTPGM